MSKGIDLTADVSAEEKVLVKSERFSLRKAIKVIFKIFAVLLIVGGIFAAGGAIRHNVLKKAVPKERYETYDYGYMYGYRYRYPSYEYRMDTNSEEYEKYENSISEGVMIFGLVVMCVSGLFFVIDIILLLLEFTFRNSQLVITDKRVFGIRRFTKRVDLPLDSVSAVSIIHKYALKVSTSSGRIIFSMIKNRDEMYKILADLLIERQREKTVQSETANTLETRTVELSSADELSKFKKLLDDGVITQEEFDTKKKLILGL